MKLTGKDRQAIAGIVVGERLVSASLCEAIYIAGYRAGAEAMRERAAKLEADCICSHPCEDYWIFPTVCPKKRMAVIRALPLPGDSDE